MISPPQGFIQKASFSGTGVLHYASSPTSMIVPFTVNLVVNSTPGHESQTFAITFPRIKYSGRVNSGGFVIDDCSMP